MRFVRNEKNNEKFENCCLLICLRFTYLKLINMASIVQNIDKVKNWLSNLSIRQPFF